MFLELRRKVRVRLLGKPDDIDVTATTGRTRSSRRGEKSTKMKKRDGTVDERTCG